MIDLFKLLIENLKNFNKYLNIILLVYILMIITSFYFIPYIINCFKVIYNPDIKKENYIIFLALLIQLFFYFFIPLFEAIYFDEDIKKISSKVKNDLLSNTFVFYIINLFFFITLILEICSILKNNYFNFLLYFLSNTIVSLFWNVILRISINKLNINGLSEGIFQIIDLITYLKDIKIFLLNFIKLIIGICILLVNILYKKKYVYIISFDIIIFEIFLFIIRIDTYIKLKKFHINTKFSQDTSH